VPGINPVSILIGLETGIIVRGLREGLTQVSHRERRAALLSSLAYLYVARKGVIKTDEPCFVPRQRTGDIG